jgi:hypothetical protein
MHSCRVKICNHIERLRVPSLHFDIFVSQSVLNDISKADAAAAEKKLAAVSGIKVLSTNLLAKQLALDLVKHGLVPHASAEDALHIAVAAADVFIDLEF